MMNDSLCVAIVGVKDLSKVSIGGIHKSFDQMLLGLLLCCGLIFTVKSKIQNSPFRLIFPTRHVLHGEKSYLAFYFFPKVYFTNFHLEICLYTFSARVPSRKTI